jgi:hypothetical protein
MKKDQPVKVGLFLFRAKNITIYNLYSTFFYLIKVIKNNLN